VPRPRRQPPRLRVIEETETETERRATWLELFFDLVFVVAIAELAGVLHDDPDWGGAARFLGLSVPVVWVWMNFIFYADQFDTDDVPYRLAVFAGMLASAALAVSLGAAGTGFVVAYVAIKAIMVGLYERARRHADTRLARRFCAWCVAAFASSGALWVLSLAFDDPVRQLLWALGLAVEIGTPAFGPREFAEMPFDVAHIPERYGLFTIIVFGESIVVTALGIGEGGSAWVAGAAFGIACALWWLYFDRIEDNRLGGAIRPNLLFIYGHPPLFAALTAVAVGAELAIEHAGGHALAPHERALLAGGVAASLAATTLVQAATLRPPPRATQVVRAAAVALSLALIAVPLPALALTGVLVALTVVCAFSRSTPLDVARAGA
jgi:low temperature requirement protein LtrA